MLPRDHGWVQRKASQCWFEALIVLAAGAGAADLSGNGIAEGVNAQAFSDAASTSSAQADLNEDGRVSAEDLETFAWSYESMNAE